MLSARFRIHALKARRRWSSPYRVQAQRRLLRTSGDRPYQSASGAIRAVLGHWNSVAKRHPVAVAGVLTSVKAVVGDLVVQLTFEGRDFVDWRRSALFASFGFLYQGLAQYFVINVVLERALFPGTSPRAVVSKIVSPVFIC